MQRGLSQRDLATGVVNPSYISLLESGSRVPTLDVVIQLSQALDVPLTSLYLSDPVPMVEPDVSDLMWQILAGSAADFGDLAAARTRIEAAYVESRRRGQPERVIEVGLALRQVLALAGDHAAELDLLEGLLPTAEAIHAPAVLVKLKIDYAAAGRSVGRYVDARRYAESALREIGATDLRETTEHVRLYGVLVAILCDSGDTDTVPELLERMFAISENTRSPAVSGRANWAAATAYARLGQPDRVADHLRKAREIMRGPTTSVRDWAHFTRAAASVLIDAAGDREEIAEYLASAAAAAWVTGSADDQVQVDALRARFEMATGDPARAIELGLPLLESEPKLVGYDLVRLRVAGPRRPAAATATRPSPTVAAEYAEERAFRLASDLAGTRPGALAAATAAPITPHGDRGAPIGRPRGNRANRHRRKRGGGRRTPCLVRLRPSAASMPRRSCTRPRTVEGQRLLTVAAGHARASMDVHESPRRPRRRAARAIRWTRRR
jgi:transcriptional regulator with XRE-family HTH domain